jgi:hypothetical protein
MPEYDIPPIDMRFIFDQLVRISKKLKEVSGKELVYEDFKKLSHYLKCQLSLISSIAFNRSSNSQGRATEKNLVLLGRKIEEETFKDKSEKTELTRLHEEYKNYKYFIFAQN